MSGVERRIRTAVCAPSDEAAYEKNSGTEGGTTRQGTAPVALVGSSGGGAPPRLEVGAGGLSAGAIPALRLNGRSGVGRERSAAPALRALSLERLDVDVPRDGAADTLMVDADVVGDGPQRHPRPTRIKHSFEQRRLCGFHVRRKPLKVIRPVAHGVCEHRSDSQFHRSSLVAVSHSMTDGGWFVKWCDKREAVS